MRVLLLAAACGGLLASGLSAAPIPKMKEKTTNDKLIGKWKLVKSDVMVSTTYEFYIHFKPNGEMAFLRVPLEEGGPNSVSDGKYKVTKVDEVAWTVNENGNERGETSKLKTLTDNKLIIEDPDGIKEEFEKVVEKEAKKDEKK